MGESPRDRSALVAVLNALRPGGGAAVSSSREALALVVVADRIGALDGACTASLATLAATARLSRSTIYRAIASLIEGGLLVREVKGRELPDVLRLGPAAKRCQADMSSERRDVRLTSLKEAPSDPAPSPDHRGVSPKTRGVMLTHLKNQEVSGRHLKRSYTSPIENNPVKNGGGERERGSGGEGAQILAAAVAANGPPSPAELELIQGALRARLAEGFTSEALLAAMRGREEDAFLRARGVLFLLQRPQQLAEAAEKGRALTTAAAQRTDARTAAPEARAQLRARLDEITRRKGMRS